MEIYPILTLNGAFGRTRLNGHIFDLVETKTFQGIIEGVSNLFQTLPSHYKSPKLINQSKRLADSSIKRVFLTEDVVKNDGINFGLSQHLGKLPTYCFVGIGVTGTVVAWTATICYFFASSCVGWPFFLF